MEMPDEGSQGGPATATETDGEPVSVLVGAAVAVTSGEENDNEDDVLEDKGSESVVEGVKDGDEKEEDDDETLAALERIGSLTSDKDTIARYTRKSKILASTSKRPLEVARFMPVQKSQTGKTKADLSSHSLSPKVNLGLALNPVLLDPDISKA
ncbi:LOW QUALITY PROTEIN: hypothetical protein YC2023_041309 [Brassica napus]